MNKLKKIFIGLFAIIAATLLYAYIAYPAEYVNRVLRWGHADVYDYQKFPERMVEASDAPLEFAYHLDEERVRTQFELAPAVDNFDSFLAANRTQAFIVIQNDEIIYEQYFNGADRESIVTSFSTAKSFASTLIGIAIDEGHIHSVDDHITDYLPELGYRNRAFENITIRNLLMMSSGIKYKEFPFLNGDDAKTYYYPDLRALALEKTTIISRPGEIFHYNNYHPLLLGMIIERATGTSVADYLQEKVWQPMGAEYPASWSLDEAGFEKMESGINGRAIDFAKFGQLFLHNGSKLGATIVPSAWVAESTQVDSSVDYENYYYDDFIFANGQGYYKYMWWGIQRDAENYDFMALGNHGQFIYVSPQSNLVIVRFGESYGEFGGAEGWVNLFYDFASAAQSEALNPEDTFLKPFISLAKEATCAETRNRLYLIDGQYVFHSTEGWCSDAGYSHTLYGTSPQERFCYLEDSFVGPLSSCEPALNELFNTILENLDKPDLGLGEEHSVEIIFEMQP